MTSSRLRRLIAAFAARLDGGRRPQSLTPDEVQASPDKDAGSPNSSAIWATEDAVWRRLGRQVRRRPDSPSLGGVEGRVGAGHQVLGVELTVLGDRDTDADRDLDADRTALADLVAQPLGDLDRVVVGWRRAGSTRISSPPIR